MKIHIVYFVLNGVKVNVGRRVRCAIHAAHWVWLHNIVSNSLLLQQVWLLNSVGQFVEKVRYY
jgi:hypothetical protein